MSTRALALPQHVNDLAVLTLQRLGIRTPNTGEDAITAPLQYDDGTELSLVILCIAQRRLLIGERPMVLLSVAELDRDRRAVRIFARELMQPPRTEQDFPFMVQLSAKIRAMAWSIAATAGFGECVSLPGRPALVIGWD